MKHRIFLGCSKETLPLADAVSVYLKDLADVDIWYQNIIYETGNGTQETLIRKLSESDFAVFILGPDDEIVHRGKSGKTPRANVLFELGLFMGALGRKRVFPIFSDQEDLIVPSDFEGVTYPRYASAGLDLKNPKSCMDATKDPFDTIRVAIQTYQPPERGYILTNRAVRSLSSYLSFRQEDVRIAVEADASASVRKFDEECHAALDGTHIYESIKSALGDDFGLYVQAVGAVGDNERRRNVNCCVRRPGEKFGGESNYLTLLMENDSHRPKEGELLKDLAQQFESENLAFGQWLLGSDFDPAPLAVIVDYSEKAEWDAQVIAVHNTALGFKIDVSGASNNYGPAQKKLKDGKVKLGGIVSRFTSLQRMLTKKYDRQPDNRDHENDDRGNYIGTVIKSVLFVPIHGWPGITLQIMTDERLRIDTQIPELAKAANETKDSSIRLTIDEMISIRLCGERLQSLLAHRLKRVSSNVG
jgi:hypothetical protein